MVKRRSFLAGFGASLLGGIIVNRQTRWAPSRNETSPVLDAKTVGVELVADGFTQPTVMVSVPGRRIRYVADKRGKIFVHDENGTRAEPLLDLTDQLAEQRTWEQGLLGLELDPDFETNGKFYVRYSGRTRQGTPDDFSHTFVLSEFTARPDRRQTVANSERVILELPQPGPNHNAGAITFGPGGYLYVAVGTGSANGGDRKGKGHVSDWNYLNSGGNGQDVEGNLKGSILRIDVHDKDDGKPYAVPSDNPLVGEEGKDEQYAWGFRNPFRMSFDGDDLYVADVGQNRYEEINRVRRGGNYGWNVREGYRCPSNRLPVHALGELPFLDTSYPICPSSTPSGEPFVNPVVCYPHERDDGPSGRAVTGGYMYRNDTISSLTDAFVFSDLMGGLFVAMPREGDEELWPMAELTVPVSDDVQLSDREAILSLARDREGELYVLTTQFSPDTGKVYRLVPGRS